MRATPLPSQSPARLPFTDWHANSAWAALCIISLALVGWFQNACLTGELAKAAPKRLRWQLWRLPALVCRTARQLTLRLPQQHPGARALLATAHPAEPPAAARPKPNPNPPSTAPPRRRAIFAWIGRYNTQRNHSTLDYQTPTEWEDRYRQRLNQAA